MHHPEIPDYSGRPEISMHALEFVTQLRVLTKDSVYVIEDAIVFDQADPCHTLIGGRITRVPTTDLFTMAYQQLHSYAFTAHSPLVAGTEFFLLAETELGPVGAITAPVLEVSRLTFAVTSE